jgi:hypothetical protein
MKLRETLKHQISDHIPKAQISTKTPASKTQKVSNIRELELDGGTTPLW